MNIVITGANGYIAGSLKKWFEGKQDGNQVSLLSLRDPSWEQYDFSKVDTVIHTAALVHKNEKEHELEEYREINTRLTLKLAQTAKAQGVRHFVFISTMAVYGIEPSCFRATEINRDTVPSPKSKYGISKYEAEQALQKLQSEDFLLSVIRPPFVYGPNCPGNYRTLRSLTLKLGIIPKLKNIKSVIYVNNLCECIYRICVKKVPSVFCPQNERAVSTWEIASLISACNQKKALCSGFFNPFVKLGSKAVRKIRVAFGNEYYSGDLSTFPELGDYIVTDFETSIRETEASR